MSSVSRGESDCESRPGALATQGPSSVCLLKVNTYQLRFIEEWCDISQEVLYQLTVY